MASRVVAGSRVAVCFPAAGRRRAALVVRAQAEQRVDPTEETAASSPSPSSDADPGGTEQHQAQGGGWREAVGRVRIQRAGAGADQWEACHAGVRVGAAVEASSGGGIISQAGSGSGMAWFAATAAVFSAASLVPLLSGESAEARSGAFMSANAELWNGRFAMLGLVALALTEYLTGAPFVNI
ncbi:hypothetical protein GUJ93_ZPchr0013g34958 [Zizania palustris]|uniref:Uncharacterized protein n=1 Tax=Zizania palustris TaxID=103762 RepID=A0A8J5X9M0_ZIZPA|nr:hypothetical protein GUJ93_ZPchr0013g34958 [Zizania palustris]